MPGVAAALSCSRLDIIADGGRSCIQCTTPILSPVHHLHLHVIVRPSPGDVAFQIPALAATHVEIRCDGDARSYATRGQRHLKNAGNLVLGDGLMEFSWESYQSMGWQVHAEPRNGPGMLATRPGTERQVTGQD